MSQDDIAYYRSRAVAAREAAKDAGRAEIAEIHQELARLYDALIEDERLRPTLWIRTKVDEDVQDKNAAKKVRKRGDMGQGSREESQAAGKGPSQSKQGPKRVSMKKRRNGS